MMKSIFFSLLSFAISFLLNVPDRKVSSKLSAMVSISGFNIFSVASTSPLFIHKMYQFSALENDDYKFCIFRMRKKGSGNARHCWHSAKITQLSESRNCICECRFLFLLLAFSSPLLHSAVPVESNLSTAA